VTLQISALTEIPSALNYHKDARSVFLSSQVIIPLQPLANLIPQNFVPQLLRLTDVFRAVFCFVHFVPPHSQ
jgi:hypothetical protein